MLHNRTDVADSNNVSTKSLTAIPSSTEVEWHTVNASSFWSVADQIQAETLNYAAKLFTCVEHADPLTLRSILIQYRYFTVYYISDLSLLVARLENGTLRSYLADILSDELGRGNAAHAHPRLYDNFMCSIGSTLHDLSTSALKSNVDLLDNARRKLLDPHYSCEFAVGLRGMGGECVCQIYIAQLHQALMKNAYIRERISDIDWHFWDLHVGDHDIEHSRRTRDLINDAIVIANEHGLLQLGRGFGESMISWRSFWENIFESTSMNSASIERAVVESAVDLKALTN